MHAMDIGAWGLQTHQVSQESDTTEAAQDTGTHCGGNFVYHILSLNLAAHSTGYNSLLSLRGTGCGPVSGEWQSWDAGTDPCRLKAKVLSNSPACSNNAYCISYWRKVFNENVHFKVLYKQWASYILFLSLKRWVGGDLRWSQVMKSNPDPNVKLPHHIPDQP